MRLFAKPAFLGFFLIAILIVPLSADTPADLVGKWSGNWMPAGGVADAMTVEFQLEGQRLTGKSVTPSAMPFTKTTFDSKTGAITFEATDQKSGKHYKLDGKVKGTELKGTLEVGDVKGEMMLIKWTFAPR